MLVTFLQSLHVRYLFKFIVRSFNNLAQNKKEKVTSILSFLIIIFYKFKIMNLPHWHHWRAKSKWHQWSSGFGQTTLLQKTVSLKTSSSSPAWSSVFPWLQNCNVGWYLLGRRTQPMQWNKVYMFFFFFTDFVMLRQEKNWYHRSHYECVHRLNRTKQDCTQTSHASLFPLRKVHCQQSPERRHRKVLLCRSGYFSRKSVWCVWVGETRVADHG